MIRLTNGLSLADFGKLIADETEKWGNVIRALNIRPSEARSLSGSGRHSITAVARMAGAMR